VLQPPVNVREEGEESWKPLTLEIQLDAGDHIMTEKGGFVDLIFEDGSTLHIDEETQLGISELQFSEAQEIRVSRLKLFWGTILAKAVPKTYKTNVFEVETNTVLAGFKFSGMKMFAQRAETVSDIPITTLWPFEGKFDLQQTGTGITDVECLLEGDLKSGVMFSMSGNDAATLAIDQTRGRETITVNSNTTLSNVQALLSEAHNLLRVENAVEAPVIGIGFQRYQITIGQNSTGIIGFAPDQARQTLDVRAEAIEAMFIFGQTTDIPLDRMYVFAERGNIAIDGQQLQSGNSVLLPISEVPPAPAEGSEEQPVAPPAPKEAPRGRRVGSPVLP
jgi:hypothetical protein